MNIADTFFQYAKPESKFIKDDLFGELEVAAEGVIEAISTMCHVNDESLSNVLGNIAPFGVASHAYDYAISGVLDLTDGLSYHDMYLDYMAFITQAQNANEFYAAGCVPKANKHIALVSYIRFKLDQDTYPDWKDEYAPVIFSGVGCGFLTLKEVAFLAQMTEKAVRNATQPNASDRLITIKEGTRTVVDSHEALRWLKGRRHFIQTKICQ